jgi:hypothetical protein
LFQQASFILYSVEICPNTVDQLCTNVNNETATTAEERGCDFSNVAYGTELGQMVDVFDTTLTTVLDSVEGLEDDLFQLQDGVLFGPGSRGDAIDRGNGLY